MKEKYVVTDMAYEALARGVFNKSYNAEKDLWIKDISEIIEICKQRMTDAELNDILKEVRPITNYLIK